MNSGFGPAMTGPPDSKITILLIADVTFACSQVKGDNYTTLLEITNPTDYSMANQQHSKLVLEALVSYH